MPDLNGKLTEWAAPDLNRGPPPDFSGQKKISYMKKKIYLEIYQ